MTTLSLPSSWFSPPARVASVLVPTWPLNMFTADHYLRPRTVVPSTSNVAPTTCTVPTDTRTVAPPTSTVPHDTCTVALATRTVDHDTCTLASSARTVEPTTSTLASSATSVGRRTRFVVAPATVTVATGSVTVTTSTVCDAGLAHARFNDGLACGPTLHTESIRDAEFCSY